MDKRYSVLMSVYKKERPEYLHAALKSMTGQSWRPSEIVLVCDGPLTTELEAVLEDIEFQGLLKTVRLEQNAGLGAALAKGLPECSCEWVARMDSDDIAASNRCEKQLRYLETYPETDVLSGTIAEFQGEAQTEREAKQSIVSRKCVPRTQTEVASYIKMRNPVNHPCVMFRKSKALTAGGYQPCPLFEDYDLWVRMFQAGCRFANLPDRRHIVYKAHLPFLDRDVSAGNAEFCAVQFCSAVQNCSQPDAESYPKNDLREEIKESRK